MTFRYKDYRTKNRERHKTMTIKPHEFIRRFLIHVLPSRFHRIRHYGLFANGNRVANIARARELLDVPALQDDTKAHTQDNEPAGYVKPCPCCGGELIIIETFERRTQPRAPPQQGVLQQGMPQQSPFGAPGWGEGPG